MSKTKTLSTNQKFEFITDEIHEYFRGGYKYDLLPEKLKASLDKQAMELYDLQAVCYKSFEKIVQKLQSIIYEQHPVYATVDYFWMEDETGWEGCNEFITLVFETFRLCGNINDKQDLSKIYAHLGLWDTASIPPRLQEPILKTLRKEMETMTGSEWRLLTKENKVFELLEYQNNKDRHTPVYNTVKKVLMAAMPAMKQFDATAWAIYDAIFETANKYFRIKLFLLEIRLDGNITTSFIHNSPDDLIQEFIKLPKRKRDHINKLAERRMKGEKI